MSNNGNYYFETLNRIQGELTEEKLIGRMAECQAVLGEIANSAAWQILLHDSRGMIKDLDASWCDMNPEEKQFKEARIIKMACKHISELPGKYLEELEKIQERLAEMQAPDRVILKDADSD